MSSLLDVKAVSKRYNSLAACTNVDISIGKGEIHGLIGENGAGKSTLVKMIYGLVRPDAGTIKFDGDPLIEHHPIVARRKGISLVFQHFALFEPLTVLENVRLGLSDDVEYAVLRDRLSEISARYALEIDVDRTVSSLSVSEKQRIEIVRCLLQSPRLLMMDEPTSVLTPQEIEHLLRLMAKIADDGCAILFISHKLHEVKRSCDRLTVMRRGQVVFNAQASAVDVETMAEHMIGSSLQAAGHKAQYQGRANLLKVAGLNQPASGDNDVELQDMAFEINAGEIVGIAGIAGNGQNELLAALSGEQVNPVAGSIKLKGQSVAQFGPGMRRQAGLNYVPENRMGHGSVPSMSLVENVVLTAWDQPGFTRFKLLYYEKARAFAKKIIEQFDVRTPGSSNLASQLSGGNLQKFIVGREILLQPDVLIIAHPTWGVDAAAAMAIRTALVTLAADGAGVLVFSQDLDELMEIANRIIVINNGRLSDSTNTEDVTAADIGLLMAAEKHSPEFSSTAHALAN